ncbi:HEPN domain-containing protein [Clostridium beijerinckii]|uniref:RiboL-PSP-HEPN domain-containing protein n=1 Tax=Clostridium beijerinckii TaxID=1520 RepID=A0A1S9N3N5_CLOBE|nr:HEPN domain-containing protein [Clostridium beijerinckii]OOP72138.1 hypothetical protein CBEIBR21_17970 [Clostridium beijerinckii]
MNRAYRKFELLMSDTKNISSIYDYLQKCVKGPLNYDDLLRLQWVQSVSALDKLVHDLVRVGMVHIFTGRRSSTVKYRNFQVDMNWYELVASTPYIIIPEFEKKVIKQHGYLAFEDPDKISDALSNIWDANDKWKLIADRMYEDKNTVRITLKNIVTRRNQIAHEGDYIDDFGNRQVIEKIDTDVVLNFIDKVGTAIYECVR